jgi:hypothetical protein
MKINWLRTYYEVQGHINNDSISPYFCNTVHILNELYLSETHLSALKYLFSSVHTNRIFYVGKETQIKVIFSKKKGIREGLGMVSELKMVW